MHIFILHLHVLRVIVCFHTHCHIFILHVHVLRVIVCFHTHIFILHVPSAGDWLSVFDRRDAAGAPIVSCEGQSFSVSKTYSRLVHVYVSSTGLLLLLYLYMSIFQFIRWAL